MKREQLDCIVGEELDHIPEGSKGSAQQELRLAYNMIHRRELGRNPNSSKEESLRYAIDAVRVKSPDFQAEHDRHYFALG